MSLPVCLFNFKPVKSKDLIPIGQECPKFLSRDRIIDYEGRNYKLIEKKQVKLNFLNRSKKLVSLIYTLGMQLGSLYSSINCKREDRWIMNHRFKVIWELRKKYIYRLCSQIYKGEERIRFGIPQISLEHPTEVLSLKLPADLSEPLKFSSEIELYEKAVTFYQKAENLGKKAPAVITKKEFSTLKETAIIEKCLAMHRGFCIGEDHTHLSAKQFIVDHLPFLYLQKVRVLFLENETQKEIDESIKIIKEELLPELETKLAVTALYHEKVNLVRGYFLKICRPNFDPGVLGDKAAAKQTENAVLKAMAILQGIELLSLDDKTRIDLFATGSSLYDLEYRHITMNYAGYHLIQAWMEKNRESKYVALMGYAHLGEVEKNKILGVPDLLGCPKFVVLNRPKYFWQSYKLKAFLDKTDIDLVHYR